MDSRPSGLNKEDALTWPFGLQRGEWSWRSFTAGENAGKTIITVYCADKPDLQYWMILDWPDYDASPEAGRGEAENTAKLICAAVNAYLATHELKGAPKPLLLQANEMSGS